jgi:hypothetical protein
MSGGIGREWSSDHDKAREALRTGKPAEMDRPCLPSLDHSLTLGVAPHSTLRAAIIPTPRQQGVDGDASKTGTPSWHWARLLGRVFDVDMATCPVCRRGSLRIIAAITQESVMTRILRHCKLASVPPPIAPARLRQELCVFDDAHASVSP